MRLQALLQPSQAYVCQDCQGRGWDCAGKNDLVVDHGEAAKNIFAQTTSADGGGDSGESDGNDGGNAHARDDDAKGQREFYLPEKLAVGHAHAASGLDHSGIHAFDAGVGAADKRQERVHA